MNESLKNNLIAVLFVISLVVLYTIDNETIKIVLGIGLVSGLIISMIQIQRSVELTKSTKRLAWLILLPLFTILKHLFAVLHEV